MGPLVAPLIGAGMSILGNVMSGESTRKENRRNRDFAVRFYDKQRQDSLADWAMQNEYNSPKEQMARLRDAKLNPNLVYGHGADAQMGAPIRSSSASVPQGQAAQYDFSGVSNSIASYQDLKLKEAQTDNLTAARTVMAQDANLKAAQVLKTLSEGKSTQFDYEMKEHLKDISIDTAKEANRKLSGEAQLSQIAAEIQDRTFDNKIKISDNELTKAKAEARQALNQADASNHLERRVIQEIDNLAKDGDLKKFQINLNRLGINNSDPAFLRIITQLFGNKVKTP